MTASLKAMVHLPTYVALKATYGGAPFKYLGVEDDAKLAYSTDKVVSDRAKFAIEPAGDGIAHIRSCYNNKYWVRSLENENWIAAAAKDPVEDKTAWNCTLFKAKVSDDGKTVKFVHVQLEKAVGRRDVAPDREMYLCLEPLATTEDVSAVVDYGMIMILPQYVAFKDRSGLFLNVETLPLFLITNVSFRSDDIGHEGNVFEILTTRDGHIYVKGVHSEKYWTSKVQYMGIEGHTRIFCYKDYKDEGDDPTDTDMLFWVAKVDKDIVALRHLDTNKFLEKNVVSKNTTPIQRDNYGLTPTSNSITRETQLQVVVPIRSREVNVFAFHLERARIYGRKPLTHVEQIVPNPSTKDEQQTTLQFSYTKTATSTWNTSRSWNMSFKVSFTSGIPSVAEQSIEIGGQYSEQYDMGKSVEVSEQVQSSYTVKVPPLTKAIVSAISTQAKCDVPYSYDQVDQMYNGDVNRTTMSDGIYTGVNSYHLDYQVRYEPL